MKMSRFCFLWIISSIRKICQIVNNARFLICRKTAHDRSIRDGFLLIEVLVSLSVVCGIMMILGMLYAQTVMVEHRLLQRLHAHTALISYVDMVRVGMHEERSLQKYYEGYCFTVRFQKEGAIRIAPEECSAENVSEVTIWSMY